MPCPNLKLLLNILKLLQRLAWQLKSTWRKDSWLAQRVLYFPDLPDHLQPFRCPICWKEWRGGGGGTVKFIKQEWKQHDIRSRGSANHCRLSSRWLNDLKITSTGNSMACKRKCLMYFSSRTTWINERQQTVREYNNQKYLKTNFDYNIDVSHLSLVFSLTNVSILDETPAFHDWYSMSTLSW